MEHAALQAFKPDLLISAGTAGGFKARGGEIGDVYISKAVMHHDRRIAIPVGAPALQCCTPTVQKLCNSRKTCKQQLGGCNKHTAGNGPDPLACYWQPAI
jgi:nucleoside phosphorylase